MRMTGLLILTAALIPAAAPARAAADAPSLRDGLAAHKALYDIELTSKRSGSQIVNIDGKMYYEWKPGCEAWITDHRFSLDYEYADSPPIRVASDFSTYETYDGKSLSYSSRRKRGGELYQEVRGQADLDENGAGEAVYTIPDGLSFHLDKGALFPMAHSLELLENAVQGKTFFSAVVFDGSDEDGPVEINSFIGKQVNALSLAGTRPSIDASLLNVPAWQVRMAFFPLQDSNADAEYEMDAIFLKNGVISDMTVEYRDFTVTQKLAALEKIEPETCGNSGKK